MTQLAACLARYGEYHRDRRNVATHSVGIPMIVLAVEVLLQAGAPTALIIEEAPFLVAALQFLGKIGYPYCDETRNPAYRLFLG